MMFEKNCSHFPFFCVVVGERPSSVSRNVIVVPHASTVACRRNDFHVEDVFVNDHCGSIFFGSGELLVCKRELRAFLGEAIF